MIYDLLWTKNALKSLSKLDKQMAQRIIDKLEFIKDDPFSSIKRLHGIDMFSLRVGDYRVLLAIDFSKGNIIVNGIGNRSNVCNKL